MAEFEATFCWQRPIEPLTIAHLAKAVALHRLVHELNARIIPVGIDGEGTYRAIRRCLDDTRQLRRRWRRSGSSTTWTRSSQTGWPDTRSSPRHPPPQGGMRWHRV